MTKKQSGCFLEHCVHVNFLSYSAKKGTQTPVKHYPHQFVVEVIQ